MATTSNPFGGRGNITIGDSAAAGPGLVPHPHQTLVNSLFDKGILKDTLLPSLTIHSGLAVLAYAAGRATDRLESKDWLWPTAQVANAWWASVGRRLITPGASATVIFSALSRPERLILAGVTLWGGRLAYRLARRSLERGQDDPRYAIAKKEEGFWNKAFFNVYLPEAALQSIITLTFTAPFNHQGAVLTGYHPLLQAVAVGLFGTGFALEVLADWQLDEFKKRSGSQNAMCREGVWSLVRHPK
jgi:steroid 5-alpha reductase family enzyme